MKNGIWLACVVALVGCGGGAASGGGETTPEGSGAARTPSAPASATQFAAAIDATLAAHPGALVMEVEIDDTHHVGFLEVEYFAADGTESQEIFFDPGTMEVIEDRPEPTEPGEAETLAAVRAHLAAGQGDLRARIEDGSFTSHAIETVQEIELTMLEGHYVIACEVLRDGNRSVMYHAIDGSYLGGSADALTYLAQHPELEVR
jgi:hypothetical protein